jgi:S1-C subfamily serine protease
MLSGFSSSLSWSSSRIAGRLRLTGVNPNSPAEKAGLQAGDIVVQMGEVEVKSIEGLADALVRYKPGEKVKTTVEREGKRIDVEVTLGDPKEK